MLLKFCFFISLFFFYSFNLKSEEYCNFSSSDYVDEMMNYTKIESIEIKANNQKVWVMNSIRALYEQNNIQKERKRKFSSKIIVNYPFGYCNLDAEIRLHGDWVDTHISWDNQTLRTSLDVEILNSNIAGVTQFKLFLPEARNSYNEVISSEILRKLGFLSPRTKIIDSKINGFSYEVIFQEKIVKEFLEDNDLREGAILEGDESLMFLGSNAENNLNQISLSRIINSNWAKKNVSNLISSIKALEALQEAYISKSRADLNVYIDWKKIFENLPRSEDYEKYIKKNEILVMALGGTHSMYASNRKFYYDQLNETLLPIYYDSGPDLNDTCLFLNCSDIAENFYRDILDNSSVSEIKNDFFRLLDSDDFILNIFEDHKVPKNIYFEYIEYVKNRFKRFEKIDFDIKPRGETNYSISDYQSKAFNLKKDLSLLFLNDIDWINKTVSIDLCDLNNCKNNQVTSLDYFYDILKRDTKLEKDIFFVKSNINDLFEFKQINFDNDKIKIFYNLESPVPYFDKSKKELIFKQKYGKEQYIIINSNLENIDIHFYGVNDLSNKNTFNKFNQTGCLNIIDTKVENINIFSTKGICEDSVNFVRSNGHINKIDIKEAYSDAIDFDFSDIKLDQLIIDRANNDCSDFSGGHYEISLLNLSFCGDKALSIGEFSKVKIDSFIASRSNIGIAVKDSSMLDANNVEMKIVKYCLSAYNKKNEFNGGLINIGSVNCQDFYKFKDIDHFSKIYAGNINQNSDFDVTEKTSNNNFINDIDSFASKNHINVIVEIPKGTNEKWEVDKITGSLMQDYEMGEPRYTSLNYPFNYGIIPRTSLPIKLGGDGDPLDVIIVGDKLQRGQILEAKVLGAIKMTDTGENDDKIVAVIKNYKDLTKKDIDNIFNESKTFFETYKGNYRVEFLKFLSKDEALNIISTSNQQYNKFGIRKR